MKKNNSFSKLIFRTLRLSNTISSIFLLITVCIFAQLKPMQIIIAVPVCGITVLVTMLLLTNYTNKIVAKELEDLYEKMQSQELADYKERTELFEKLMEFPKKKSVQTFIYFIFLTTFTLVLYIFVPGIRIDFYTALFAFLPCTYLCYYASVTALILTERTCSEMAKNLMREGIDIDYVREKKYFGVSQFMRALFFIIIPVLFTNFIVCTIFFSGFYEINGAFPSSAHQITKAVYSGILNLFLALHFIYSYGENMKGNTKSLSNSFNRLLNENTPDVDANTYAETSLADVMQHNIFILNNIIKKFTGILKEADCIGKKVLTSTDDLSIIANQLSSTSAEQSASVKEILASMEDSNALSQNIATMIEYISVSSDKTFQDVNLGFEKLSSIVDQMKEIENSNAEITDGIKKLNTLLSGIGNVVAVIKDIADQTRIIAFNAELEAVSAGSSGCNFHIVATEIRRLANSTMNSINEIKSYIENIQSSSINLMHSAQTGTDYIIDEAQLTANLKNSFEDILSLADTNSTKSEEISQIISQQKNSFTQIVITLRQISSSIESFSTMTETISITATKMQQVASRLSQLNREEVIA